jgi:hypothetical protein
MSDAAQARLAPWFWPLLLLGATVFVDTIGTSVRLRSETDGLESRFAEQERVIADAKKLREQLEAIASATAQLAEEGNENAIRLRAHLLQQGVVIRPHARGL